MSIVNFHGDLTLYPVKIKPPAKAEKSKLHVLQASETTMNRHEVYSEKNLISRWKDKDGKEYIHCPKPYHIRHIGGDAEHGIQEVEAGTREIRHEQEYDPFKHELRQVID